MIRSGDGEVGRDRGRVRRDRRGVGGRVWEGALIAGADVRGSAGASGGAVGERERGGVLVADLAGLTVAVKLGEARAGTRGTGAAAGAHASAVDTTVCIGRGLPSLDVRSLWQTIWQSARSKATYRHSATFGFGS